MCTAPKGITIQSSLTQANIHSIPRLLDDMFFMFIFNGQTVDEMIFITHLIYITPGQEELFDEFEKIAIPIIAKYNGRLLFRVRPGDAAFIETQVEKPYEIHLAEFAEEQDFENFKQDEERKKFLHMKEQSIRSSIMYKGVQL